MKFVLIIAYILRTGPDAVTTQITFEPARTFVTYDQCMRDSQSYVDAAQKRVQESDRFNKVVRYGCVPVVTSK